MDTAIWLNLIVFAVAVHSDLGRRKVGPFRVLRPLVTAVVIVPFFLKGLFFSGNALNLELTGTAIGILLGLLATSPMRFQYDAEESRVFTRAGVIYAAAWGVVTAGKICFSYGAQHWFPRQLGKWMYQNSLTPHSLTAAIICLNIAMMLARVGYIFLRARRTARAAGSATGILRARVPA